MIFKAMGRTAASTPYSKPIPYYLRFKPIAIKESPIYRDFMDRCMPGDIGEIATFHDRHVQDYERSLILECAGGAPLREHTYTNIMNTAFLELALKARLNPLLICWFERRNVITEDSVLQVAGALPDRTSRRVLQIVFVEAKNEPLR